MVTEKPIHYYHDFNAMTNLVITNMNVILINYRDNSGNS